MKTLNSESPQDRVRFLREAAIMGQFKHKNVVALKGVILQGEPVCVLVSLTYALLMSLMLLCLSVD